MVPELNENGSLNREGGGGLPVPNCTAPEGRCLFSGSALPSKTGLDGFEFCKFLKGDDRSGRGVVYGRGSGSGSRPKMDLGDACGPTL